MNFVALPSPASVAAHLENVAKQKSVVTYGTLVSHFGLPALDGAWSAHPLSSIFEVLDQEDSNAGRPFRTSVVVTANGNSPGAGFYEALDRLAGIRDPVSANARLAIWTAQLTAAHNYSW